MYNFLIPSTLKRGSTISLAAAAPSAYGAAGAEGLLKGRKVFIITGRGGIYSDGPARGWISRNRIADDAGLPRPRRHLHPRRGLKISPEAAASGIERARKTIGELLPTEA